MIAEGALTAVLVLRPTRASRNRHYVLFTTPDAKRVRRRALGLRSLVRELAGEQGPVRRIVVEHVGDRTSIRYGLPRVAADRTARLTPLEAAIVRVALARGGTRLLPAPLIASADDHATIGRLLEEAESALP
jgi:hypothetical protein